MEIGKEDNPGNPDDRNSMKKCMEEVFSETAPETESHWQNGRKAELYRFGESPNN